METVLIELENDPTADKTKVNVCALETEFGSILAHIPPINSNSADADIILAINHARNLSENGPVIAKVIQWIQDKSGRSSPEWENLVRAGEANSHARLAALSCTHKITTDPALQQALMNAAICGEGDYALQRTKVANDLSLPVSSLDKLVARCRDAYQSRLHASDSEESESELSPARVALGDDYIEPANTPQDGGILLKEFIGHIAARVHMRKDQVVVSAIYALATYCYLNFVYFPYLMITAATKAAGKTVAGETIVNLSVNPLSTSGVTPAAMYRILNDGIPLTMLLDERDTVTNPDEKSNLARILNSLRRKSPVP